MDFKQPAVYIITNKPYGTLYTGVTSDLVKRTWQHKEKLVDGFSRQYDLKLLVFFELYDLMEDAILREKRIKKWNRQWKINLVCRNNPGWEDLYPGLLDSNQKLYGSPPPRG